MALPAPESLPETYEAIMRWCMDRRHELQAEAMGKAYNAHTVDMSNRLYHIQQVIEDAYLKSFNRGELLHRQAELLAQGRKSTKIDKLIRDGDQAAINAKTAK